MKTCFTFIIFILSMTTLASSSPATISCSGLSNPDLSMTLFILDGSLRQIRLNEDGSFPRAFGINKISENETSAFYSLLGTIYTLEIQKSVIELNGGWLTLDRERFNCEAN